MNKLRPFNTLNKAHTHPRVCVCPALIHFCTLSRSSPLAQEHWFGFGTSFHMNFFILEKTAADDQVPLLHHFPLPHFSQTAAPPTRPPAEVLDLYLEVIMLS